MLNLLAIGLGGFLGAILRGLSYMCIYRLLPNSIFLATLFVNVLGSFLIGVLFCYIEIKGMPPWLRSFIGIGFLGAFTTFSTFSYENLMFLQNGFWVSLVFNILLNVGLCLFAVWLGFIFLRQILL